MTSPRLAPSPAPHTTTNESACPRLLHIGLTGGIGSGKSWVADRMVALGAALVDTDAIAHALTAPGGGAIEAIREAFGDTVIAADGRMDRAAVRARVFADPAARQRLQAILHPMILADALQQLQQLEHATPRPAYVLIAVPLLVESGHWRQRVDRVLVVDCPEETQVQRVMQRSGMTANQVRAIMATQATRAQRLAIADDVIDNGGSMSATQTQIEALHQQYLAAAREHHDSPKID